MLEYCVLGPKYNELQEKYNNLSKEKVRYFDKGCNCSLQLERNCNLTATCNVEGSMADCQTSIIETGTLQEITP